MGSKILQIEHHTHTHTHLYVTEMIIYYYIMHYIIKSKVE